jgi:hypothetical protein
MPLRRLLARLMIAIVVIVASTYVQAMAHVDAQRSASSEVGDTAGPPCHEAHHKDGDKEPGGHHERCCSNFACGMGLIAVSGFGIPNRTPIRHEIDYGNVKLTHTLQPLYPPPRTVIR